MDYRTMAAALKPSDQSQELNPAEQDRESMASELRRQAELLREEGSCAAEFWLAEQYEISARLLN